MQKLLTRVLLACAVASAAAIAPAFAQTATPSPAPKATPTVSPFSYSGYVRDYYFTRTNQSNFPQAASQINQASGTPALSLHGQYTFTGSNLTLGATYLYANPMNGCYDAAKHITPGDPCNATKSNNKTYPGWVGTRPDNTLPGFGLNTLYEAYLQYKDARTFVKVGDQVINTPWANASDSRLKPVAFQGGDLSYKFNSDWTGELGYYNRFEDRVQSAFQNATLLTFRPAAADGSGLPSNIPSPGTITNNGFIYGRLGYTHANLASNLHYYGFDKIANLLWLDGKLTWKTPIKPYVAIQYGNERSTGTQILGKIASDVYGAQAGASFGRNVDLALSYNYIPQKTDTVLLPAGTTCSTSGSAIHQIKGSLPYFLPAGGTTNCLPNADGTTNVYYGGFASPYTDSYATDPLFTTTISQGMADRRSPGQAGKIAATFQTNDKRIKLIAARAFYSYGNSAAGVSPTQETNLDGTYYFRPLPKSGPYHGLFFRYRYAERTIANTQFYGGLPVFKYNRAQLELDF